MWTELRVVNLNNRVWSELFLKWFEPWDQVVQGPDHPDVGSFVTNANRIQVIARGLLCCR